MASPRRRLGLALQPARSRALHRARRRRRARLARRRLSLGTHPRLIRRRRDPRRPPRPAHPTPADPCASPASECSRAAAPLWLLAAAAPAGLIAAAAFIAGIAFSYFASVWETTIQRAIPTDIVSRVSAYDWFGSLAFYPLGQHSQHPSPTAIGLHLALWLAGAWAAISTLGLLASPAAPHDRPPTHPRPPATDMTSLEAGDGHDPNPQLVELVPPSRRAATDHDNRPQICIIQARPRVSNGLAPPPASGSFVPCLCRGTPLRGRSTANFGRESGVLSPYWDGWERAWVEGSVRVPSKTNFQIRASRSATRQLARRSSTPSQL